MEVENESLINVNDVVVARYLTSALNSYKLHFDIVFEVVNVVLLAFEMLSALQCRSFEAVEMAIEELVIVAFDSVEVLVHFLVAYM